MKITLVSLTILLIAISNTFSQDRANRENVIFVSRSAKLSLAQGWAYNTELGKWSANNNVIDRNPALAPLISHRDQNFKWIQVANVRNEFEKYIILLYEKKSGAYEYPAIEKNWKEDLRTYWFQIDSAQYQNLKSIISEKQRGPFFLESKNYGYITNAYQILKGEHLYNEENLLAKITSSLRVANDSRLCFAVKYELTDKGDFIRFLLPDNCRISQLNFEKNYFEVPVSGFKNLTN